MYKRQLRNNLLPPTVSDRPLPGWNYAPRSADGSWDLAVGRRKIETSITEGRQRRAACALLLERLYNDAGALWHSYVAARNKVDELEMATSSLGPRDEHLEHFADVRDETPLRKLIFQKLGTEPPASCSPTVIADWVRSIGSVSSFR